MAIERYTKKPNVKEYDTQYAARYIGSADLPDLTTVARMCDRDAELYEVPFSTGSVLIVRYRRYHDDHPSTIEYQPVEPGQYLAYSEGNDFLYDSDDANWRHWYNRVEEG